MINTVCRLVSSRLFEEVYVDVDTQDKVIVRPKYLSICHADQRYYQGKRSAQTLSKKLPMALIHEAIGEVVKDFTNTFKPGDMVVMIPNTPYEIDDLVSENYLESSKFRSSDLDGFMEDYVIIDSNRLIKIPEFINPKVASFTEFVSVSVHAIKRFNEIANSRRDTIGIWGDGNLGYITALILKFLMPKSKIYIFGVHQDKLNLFSFVDGVYLVDDVPSDLRINHAIECVGGLGSQDAINQIIDLIKPEGTICLLGVSEYKVPINTRDVLSKGLHVFGVSRSGREDFLDVFKLYKKYPKLLTYLENLVGDVIIVNSLNDVDNAFNKDSNLRFGKTIMFWDK
ncbi:ribitol-5-phosphate dehydrogenase [Methanobrevibacter sp. 87.7]|uniref:alcohol dehydrogenase catalytic domain-containing protein n=1 Tax=Methanobrevibacter sp. 87.7 TaxID=387957 RepID=UPI000B50E695|nr:alcohol dehydrogenase catalytic domain-containing protein [Methanobrevibacter sp. 87.7]OWT33649.1 ribitol-5-phosphate dehydrogenase [Methanobrevibacter sp. 87.7]